MKIFLVLRSETLATWDEYDIISAWSNYEDAEKFMEVTGQGNYIDEINIDIGKEIIEKNKWFFNVEFNKKIRLIENETMYKKPEKKNVEPICVEDINSFKEYIHYKIDHEIVKKDDDWHTISVGVFASYKKEALEKAEEKIKKEKLIYKKEK